MSVEVSQKNVIKPKFGGKLSYFISILSDVVPSYINLTFLISYITPQLLNQP